MDSATIARIVRLGKPPRKIALLTDGGSTAPRISVASPISVGPMRKPKVTADQRQILHIPIPFPYSPGANARRARTKIRAFHLIILLGGSEGNARIYRRGRNAVLTQTAQADCANLLRYVSRIAVLHIVFPPKTMFVGVVVRV